MFEKALVLSFLFSGIALSAPTTGGVTRDYWGGIGGTAVADLTGNANYPANPDSTSVLPSFHAPTDVANNYGQRVYGWVHAPVTGNYVFAIHADDNAELWVSSSRFPEDRVLLASVSDWTDDGQWNKFGSQVSSAVAMVAGEYYFIEAIQKEGNGGDNLGVGWSYPGQARVHIPGSALSPNQNLPPEAADDQATLGIAGVAGIQVLANDRDPNGLGDLDLSSLEIVSTPGNGTVVMDAANGIIRYTHTGSTAGADSFSYRIADRAGLTDTALVSLNIVADSRIPLASSRMPEEPPAQEISLENAFPGIGFSQPLALRTPPGETNRLFVVEKTGDIRVISDLTNPTNTRFLDVDGIVNARGNESFQTSSEQGLLSMAFHPNYAENGRFFVVYSVTVNGTRTQRLSEFAVSANPAVADAASEKIFIQQVNDAGNHNGGDIHFGADGYLYMGWGDEGNANDTLNNSQRIDKDFWSSITRIDVDLEVEDYTPQDGTGSDDANLRPNDHPAIVKDSNGNPRYEVPADNPWVGATSFLGSAVNPANVRTEFYAVGLRNPWRMSFDPVTGVLWCADVGQDAREEVNKIVKGGNYEWAFREGFIQGAKWNQRPSGWTGSHPPVVDYGRGSGALQGMSITGGVVSRGNNIPALYGKYVFGDYVSGNIWSLDESTSPAGMTRIAGEGNIAGFGHDPSNGDVLLADLDGFVHRLVAIEAPSQKFPLTLAATGLFADAEALIPNPGLVAYDVNLSFWSDHATKQRWFGIPDPAAMIGFSREGNWTLPQGMVWVKHFDLELERGNPATKKRLETRVIVRNATGNYGVSYRWNETGTEAHLAASAGEEFDLTIDEGGTTSTQRWRIPSRAECSICHTVPAGHALSFRTRQLNRSGSIAGASGNFIRLLEEAHYLENLDTAPALLPRHVAPEETQFTSEERSRAYLEVNCAYCHNAEGSVPAQWDARTSLPLFETGLIHGIAENGVTHPDDRLITPGNDNRSVIVHRTAARNGYTRMPPIGSNVIDQQGVQLLIDWINDDLTERQSYDDWRVENFGMPPTGGVREDDDDLDGRSNYAEFIAGTNPNQPDSAPTPPLVESGGALSLTLPSMPGRSVFLESSEDLVSWGNWNSPLNDGLPRSADNAPVFPIPMTPPAQFFRLKIEER